MSILLWFALGHMPSRNARMQHRVACCICVSVAFLVKLVYGMDMICRRTVLTHKSCLLYNYVDFHLISSIVRSL